MCSVEIHRACFRKLVLATTTSRALCIQRRIDFPLEKLNGEVEFTLEVYSALASEGAEKQPPVCVVVKQFAFF